MCRNGERKTFLDLPMQPAIITSLAVNNPEIITIYLDDERSLSMLVRYFAEIENLTLEKHRRWILLEEQVFSFEDCDKVFHLQQMLGFASTADVPSLSFA
jgi:hypothetical protein